MMIRKIQHKKKIPFDSFYLTKMMTTNLLLLLLHLMKFDSATACSLGQYLAGTSSYACGECGKGCISYCTSYDCQTCSAGYYASSYDPSACTACPAGQYVSTSGATSCTSCPGGYYSSTTGSKLSCTTSCSAGYYSATGASAPTACAVGYYTSFTAQSTCSTCPAGQYTFNTGTVSCTSCPGGYYSSTTGSSLTCTLTCLAGKYSASGASVCTNCAYGTTSSATSSACISCSAGQYGESSGQNICMPCPEGQYQASSGQSACRACAAGQYGSTVTGQTSSTSCSACATGKYSTAASTECSDYCPAGWYQRDGITACFSCAAGQYSSTASTVCTLCSVLYYQASSEQGSCTSCPAGYICAATGLTAATACTSGKYALQSSTSCTSCTAGKYAASTSEECRDCSVNYYSGDLATACTKCQVGSTTDNGQGASSCISGGYYICASSVAKASSTTRFCRKIVQEPVFCPDSSTNSADCVYSTYYETTKGSSKTIKVNTESTVTLGTGTTFQTASGTAEVSGSTSVSYSQTTYKTTTSGSNSYIAMSPGAMFCTYNLYDLSKTNQEVDTPSTISEAFSTSKLVSVTGGDWDICALDADSVYDECNECLFEEGSSNKDDCFSGSDTVTLQDGTIKKLPEVEVGDRILTANSNGELSFSDVIFLPHKYNNELFEFIELSTANNISVKATMNHLMKACDGSLVYAKSLKPGNCLKTAVGDSFLTSVEKAYSRGMYTVVTLNEFVVISGVIASPFSFNHRFVHSFYNLHRAIYKLYPSMPLSALVDMNTKIGAIAKYFAIASMSAFTSEL